VLVGTTSVEKSELLSDMLTEQGVKHQVGAGARARRVR
jgi:preprotein translocase subunit SecA